MTKRNTRIERDVEREQRGGGHRRRRQQEQGIAMITAVMILVLVATTAMSLISNSEQEMTASGRSHSTKTSLYAAEAGVQFALNRLTPPRDLSAFSFSLTDGTTVQSRARSDSSPQAIEETGLGTPSGYSLNIGSGFVNETFKLNVTAAQTNLPTTELEVKLGVLTPNSGTF